MSISVTYFARMNIYIIIYTNQDTISHNESCTAKLDIFLHNSYAFTQKNKTSHTHAMLFIKFIH